MFTSGSFAKLKGEVKYSYGCAVDSQNDCDRDRSVYIYMKNCGTFNVFYLLSFAKKSCDVAYCVKGKYSSDM